MKTQKSRLFSVVAACTLLLVLFLFAAFYTNSIHAEGSVAVVENGLDRGIGIGLWRERISAEPDASALSAISAQAVLSDTISSELLPLLQELYNDEEASAGALSGAEEQLNIALDHRGFLHTALDGNNLPEARRHAEHLVNILDGETGNLYGDLDRDGLMQNPGNGIGVRVYLSNAATTVAEIQDVLAADSDASPAQNAAMQNVRTAIADGQAGVAEAIEKALQVFAADTPAEAEKFSDELQPTLQAIADNIRNAYTDSLQVAAAQSEAQTGTATATSAATSTVTHTAISTETLLVTGTSTSTNEDAGALPHTSTPIFPFNNPANRATAIAATVSARLTVLVQTPTPTHGTPTLGRTQQTTETPSVSLFASPTPTSSPSPSASSSLTSTVALSPTASISLTSPTASRVSPPPPPIGAMMAMSTTWTNEMDGAEYGYVPGGRFTVGATAAEAASEREMPAQAVEVAGFWMQRTETTNAQYARCVAADACTPPANEVWQRAELVDHPVTHVDWEQARAYATWAGGRLPSEAEWERACRNGDDRAFPWGNAPPTAELSNFNNTLGQTAAVGRYPAGASAYGILDLSGNVWEWTASRDLDYPYDATDGREDPTASGLRIVRGGSFYYTQYQLRCAARTGFAPDTANQHFGFRIIVDDGLSVPPE